MSKCIKQPLNNSITYTRIGTNNDIEKGIAYILDSEHSNICIEIIMDRDGNILKKINNFDYIRLSTDNHIRKYIRNNINIIIDGNDNISKYIVDKNYKTLININEYNVVQKKIKDRSNKTLKWQQIV